MASLPNAQPQTESHQLSNLTVRTLTALVIVPIAIIGVVVGGGLWALLLLPVACVGVLELVMMAQGGRGGLPGMAAAAGLVIGVYLNMPLVWAGVPVVSLLLAGVFFWLRDDVRTALRRVAVEAAGTLYAGVPVALLAALRADADGLLILAMIFAATWGTDTVAYFTGSTIGSRPFFPQISPKKTREGALGGLIGGGLCLVVIWLVFGGALTPAVVLLALCAPVAAIAGDLFESALKRHFHIKDSHPTGFNLIPGHGGVLDRIDSLIVVTLLFATVFALTGGIG